MAIDRNLWTPPFNFDSLPRWTCPHCKNGSLLLSKKDVFETILSQNKREKYSLPPMEGEFNFSAKFKCSNSTCQDIVISCGVTELDFDHSLDENYQPINSQLLERFTPHYFLPGLNIFEIPARCPSDVKKSIKRSFELFFADTSSAANHVRQGIENLFTDEWSELFDPNAGPKTRLHNRIESYGDKNKSVANKLLAIKWIGNTGSHSSDINRQDVLDVYVILEAVLDEIFIGSEKKLKETIENINKAKGPIAR